MSETERLYKRNVGAADTVAFSEGLRSYMLGVYNLMALGIFATAAIATFFVMNPAAAQPFLTTPLRWLPFVGVLGMGFVAPSIIMGKSKGAAQAAYWAYVALWGLLIGPVVAAYVGLGLGSLVIQAFFIASAIFVALSLYGYTTKRDLAPMAKFLFMAMVGLLVLIVANALFFHNPMASLLISGAVVLVISAVTAYETQMIRNLYVEGAGSMNERSSIFGAFALYGSFVTLFIHILNILRLTND